jgi:hypothetical protein
MNERYEVVFSPNEPALKLILLEGTWETLPFEIRLWRPWRGCTLCAGAAVTGLQRQEIAQRGFSIGHGTFIGELVSSPSWAPIANVGSIRLMPPIEVRCLASASDNRSVLIRMQRSLQELTKVIEQSMSLIVETRFALAAELTCFPRLADTGIWDGAHYRASAPQGIAAIRDGQSIAHLLRVTPAGIGAPKSASRPPIRQGR